MNFQAPQIIYICLLAMGIGISMSRHGDPKTGTHSVWSTIFATTIVVAILYWGGFFGGNP